MTKIHIVKSVFLEKETAYNSTHQGSIRAFAVLCEDIYEMIKATKQLVTPINKNGFLGYTAGKENAQDAIDAGENILLFHEDLGICYPENADILKKKYPTIKVFDYKAIIKKS